jgi:peroxiredoxin
MKVSAATASVSPTSAHPVKTVALVNSVATPSANRSSANGSIPAFTATAIDNTTFQLADRKEQILVIAFMGVECPLANLYFPRLVEIATKYQGKPVGFVAVNSNAQDALEEVRDQARSFGVTFPVLKDATSAAADALGAKRTPEVVVLDAQRNVRYRGMIDDQYGYQQRRAQPTKNYVVQAVDALLTGGAVAVAETPVQGCHIGRVGKPAAGATTSYYRDVLPILQNRCQQCHRKGEIGPFALMDYEETRDWAPTIRESVTEHRMPPWPADEHIGKFANDLSLSAQELQTLTKWIDEGCPKGEAAEKPPEKKFVDGWNIGTPDKIYTMNKPFKVPATGVIDYQYFEASPVFTQDTWVDAVECRFGNRSVVHHMLVLLHNPKDRSKSQDGLAKGFFAAGAPGSTYYKFPKGFAKRIPKGMQLVFQMHYTPTGTETQDQSHFGMMLAKGSRKEVQTYALAKTDLMIPAGDADHREVFEQTVTADVTLTDLMPHMHVRGKSFTFTAIYPSGKKQTLLSVPKWDFNWQHEYQLVEPLKLPKNSKLIVEAHWDNSEKNPNNFLPLVDVGFGEQTNDEMFIGYVNYVPTKPLIETPKRRGSRKRG